MWHHHGSDTPTSARAILHHTEQLASFTWQKVANIGFCMVCFVIYTSLLDTLHSGLPIIVIHSVYYMRYLQSKNIFFEALKNDIIMPFDDESMFI